MMATAAEFNERQRERRLNSCQHFTGLPLMDRNPPTCAAGVDYETVKDDSQAPYRWPCVNPEASTTCDKRLSVTKEQVDAEDAEHAEFMAHAAVARERIIATGRASGTVQCPKCSGELWFSVAECNGHVHARCAKDGCLLWME